MSDVRLLFAEGTRETINGVHVTQVFADVDRSDQGKASVGPHEQETTETTMREGEHIDQPVSSPTAATAGGSGDSRQHSGLPWRWYESDEDEGADPRVLITSDDGTCGEAFGGKVRPSQLGKLPSQRRANAELIVSCVNAHDALVSQREELLDVLKGLGCVCEMACGNPMVKTHSPQCDRVHAVLAKAGA